MNNISKLAADYLDQLGEVPFTETELRNKQMLLNHWIANNNTGRAHFGRVPNDCTIELDWIARNLEGANRLIEVRKECKNCRATNMKNCPYNEKQVKRARDYEREKGLDTGKLTPSKINYRPTLIWSHNQLFYAYEPCPIFEKHQNS